MAPEYGLRLLVEAVPDGSLSCLGLWWWLAGLAPPEDRHLHSR